MLSLTCFLSIPVGRVLCAVSRVVRNFLLLSDSAGEFNWWSTGVVLHDNIAGFQ